MMYRGNVFWSRVVLCTHYTFFDVSNGCHFVAVPIVANVVRRKTS